MGACGPHVNATSEARHPAVKLRSGAQIVAQSGGPKIYVGSLLREGFADIAKGIRDSIRDIGQEVRAAGFSDVNASADAAVPLKA
jgi:hypothetical protein